MKRWLVQIEIPCIFEVEVEAYTKADALRFAVQQDARKYAELLETDWGAALIRILYEHGVPSSTLARRYGVSRSHVNHIVVGRKWRPCA